MTLPLMKLLVLGAAAPLMATAQVPPTPPEAKPPVKAAKPMVKIDPYFEFGPKLDELRFHLEDMRLNELTKLDVGRVQIAEQAKEFAQLAMERAKLDVERLRLN